MAPSIGHPLLEVLERAAAGCFPPVDGEVEVLPPDRHGVHAVVEFTGHSYVLTDRSADELRARGADGFGGSMHPAVLQWLAGDHPEDRIIGCVDVVLVAPADPGAARGRRLRPRHDLEDHSRVIRARRVRSDVQVFADEQGLVTLGRGLAGRLEVSIERFGGSSGVDVGRSLAGAARSIAPADTWVWAQVSPGNAASLRAFLAAGFVPVGSEVLLSQRVPIP